MAHTPSSTERRKAACRELGIAETERLLYGAQAAADALGVSVGVIRKHVEPDDYAENPYYRHAGAPVGLYDPISFADAARCAPVIEAKAKYAKRKAAAVKGARTRIGNMVETMKAVEIRLGFRPLRGESFAITRGALGIS